MINNQKTMLNKLKIIFSITVYSDKLNIKQYIIINRDFLKIYE